MGGLESEKALGGKLLRFSELWRIPTCFGVKNGGGREKIF